MAGFFEIFIFLRLSMFIFLEMFPSPSKAFSYSLSVSILEDNGSQNCFQNAYDSLECYFLYESPAVKKERLLLLKRTEHGTSWFGQPIENGVLNKHKIVLVFVSARALHCLVFTVSFCFVFFSRFLGLLLLNSHFSLLN